MFEIYSNLACDLTKGVQVFNIDDKQYDQNGAADVLRKALVDANGGSTKLDMKALRRNKVQIFEIIEELIPAILKEKLKGDEFWMKFVEERNLALGDKNEFYTPDNSLFIVSKIADGVATPDRQRIGGATTKSVETAYRAVRIYDEWSRFMAGRIDWNDLCDRVARSFKQEMWNDVYVAFNGISDTTDGLSATYVKSGSWNEDTMLNLCADIGAETGVTPIIFGTAAALRKVKSSVIAESAKDALHNMGYYGKFYGYEEVMIPQAHESGTDNRIFDDNTVYVVGGDDQFIKFVNEGDAYITDTDGSNRADMTIEYFMRMKWGIALMFSSKCFGKYTIA